MTFRVGSGFAEIDDVRISEVRGWDDSVSGSEVDTSVIGNVDSNGRPVKRTMPGAAAQTLNLQMYYDPTDPSQSELEQGATGLTIVIFTGGDEDGLEKRTYTGCSVNTAATSGQNFEGLVEYTANLSFDALAKSTISS